MGRNYGMRAEPIVIRTKPLTLRQLLWVGIKTAAAGLLFKIKVKLGWRYR